MKTLSFFTLLLILFGINMININMDSFRQNCAVNPVKELISFSGFHCPDAPAFTETVKTVSSNTKDQTAGSDIDQSWYEKAMEDINNEEYNISYSEELGTFQSPNRANNIRFTYNKDGFSAKTRNNKIPLFDVNDKTLKEEDKKYESIPEWSIDFKIKNEELGIKNSELQASGNKASIENENIRIDYTNNKDGMRQDFIIKKKPEGDGKLRLNINADTKLKMIVGADALMFKDKDGVEKMKYSALKVWDAEGRELRAYFENNYELGIRNYELKSKINNSNKEIPNSQFLIPNSFSIVVNDENAVYPVTIDPLSTSPVWNAEIDQSEAQFGYCVATAGDVNGDGYSDVIVGAPFYDNGEMDEGKAFVYHGSATGLTASSQWSAERNQANAQYGFCVATAGDVNGDGYSDVLVSMPYWDNGQTDEGGIDVYFGSASGLSATVSNHAEGNQNNAHYGYSAGSGGDINGDGYSDLLVGAPHYDNVSVVDGGRLFGYFGSPSGILFTDFIRQGNVANSYLGFSVATAGDVNGDGFSDIIVGVPGWNSNNGRAYIYHGSSTVPGATESWAGQPTFPSGDFQYGFSVATAGDVNGDGYSDVIVGAAYSDQGGIDAGYAYVYLGTSTGTSYTISWSRSGNQVQSLGYSVSTAGDINGDGYSDIIIGSNPLFGDGSAVVFNGSATGILSSSFNYLNNAESVATAGDVNGDGFSDVIIGSRSYSSGETNEGRASVYHGSPVGLSVTTNWTAESDQTGAFFGHTVSAAGDVNGDGYNDVIIGAPTFDNGQTDEGKVFVYHGSSSGISPTINWSKESDQTGAQFGYSVSTAGDVNGDGYSDVIIGANKFDNGETDEGRAFVYNGSASGLALNSSWTGEYNQSGAQFGFSVASAGDVNGDGYSDVIVGAPYYDFIQINEGFAFVYHGSSTGLTVNPVWSKGSSQADAEYGISVSGAGDINGDGFSDIIVGAHLLDGGQFNEGRAYIYHGSNSGLSLNANWTAEGDQTGAQFGYSVACAGDVNGDGYSDIITGAFGYDNGQTNEGRTFVYNGSSSGVSNSPGWTFETNQAEAYGGFFVSTAGDVNGDGYSDILVGAPLFDNGQFDEGRVFLFNGSDAGLSNTASWTSEGNQIQAIYGSSVSSAGDVNGDGYSDVIIGCYGFDNGQVDEGKAFVFYGNNGTSLRSTVQQYKPSTNDIVYSGSQTGTDGQVRLNIFGKSPFGRADGKIIYEYKENGMPYSGSVITNSASFSGEGNYSDLGISGNQLNNDISGLNFNKLYKWRARVQYSPVNNPFQKFGPWKYYNNFVPVPTGNFRPCDGIPPVQLNLTMFIQGFYNSGANAMVGDTVRVYLRNSSMPYEIVDSAKSYVNSSGQETFQFPNAVNGVNYYIQLNHRNSIETWSMTTQTFNANLMTYNFSSAYSQAYGFNLIVIDASPLRFAIFSGDENQDGIIDLNDVVNVSNAANAFSVGYLPTDMNGDNLTDLSDLIITFNNASDFVEKITP